MNDKIISNIRKLQKEIKKFIKPNQKIINDIVMQDWDQDKIEKIRDQQRKEDKKMETIKVEIEGKDGINRIYTLSLEEFVKIQEKKINFKLILN